MGDKEMLDVGYIYSITTEEDDKIYYGSTKDWQERLRTHRSKWNKCMTMYMIGNKQLNILKTCYNISRRDLQKIEREFIENHNEESSGKILLNKQVPTQTVKEYHKNRYNNNPDYYAGLQRDYYWKNLEKEKVRNKVYREKRKGDTWFCPVCRNLYAWTTKKTHIKSIKHLNNLNNYTTPSSTESATLEDTGVNSSTNSTTNP